MSQLHPASVKVSMYTDQLYALRLKAIDVMTSIRKPSVRLTSVVRVAMLAAVLVCIGISTIDSRSENSLTPNGPMYFL